MKKIILIGVMIMICSSFVVAEWWNPLSWFEKNTTSDNEISLVSNSNTQTIKPRKTTDSEWKVTHKSGNEANFILHTTNSKDKKTDICFVLEEGIEANNVDLSDKYLYQRNGSLMLDDKNKPIKLKYESNKCNGKDGYFISLTDAKAVNIDGYLKMGSNSIQIEYGNTSVGIYNNTAGTINVMLNSPEITTMQFEDNFLDYGNYSIPTTSNSEFDYVDGIQGDRAIYFKDDNNRVTFDNDERINTNHTNLTILVYLERTKSTDGSSQDIVDKATGDLPKSGYSLTLDEADPLYGMTFRYGDGTTASNEASIDVVPLGKWSCIGLTANIETQELRWFNGSPEAFNTDNLNTPNVIFGTIQPLIIGSRDGGSGEINGNVSRVLVSRNWYSDAEQFEWCENARGTSFQDSGTYTSEVFALNDSYNMINLTSDTTSWEGYEVEAQTYTTNMSFIDGDMVFGSLVQSNDEFMDYTNNDILVRYENDDGTLIQTNDYVDFENSGGVNGKILVTDASSRAKFNTVSDTSEISIFVELDLNSYLDTAGGTSFIFRGANTVTFDLDTDIRFFTYGTSGTCISAPVSDLGLGRHKMLAIKDLATNRGLLYVDGVLVENDSCSGTVGGGANELVFGSDNGGSVLNGTIYSFAYWNRSLTNDEAITWTDTNYDWILSAKQELPDGINLSNYAITNTTTYLQTRYTLPPNGTETTILNNYNLTAWNFVSGEAPPEDTCTTGLTTGIFDCSDNCNLGNVNLNGLPLIITGTGTFTGNVTNYVNKTFTSISSCIAWINKG